MLKTSLLTALERQCDAAAENIELTANDPLRSFLFLRRTSQFYNPQIEHLIIKNNDSKIHKQGRFIVKFSILSHSHP